MATSPWPCARVCHNPSTFSRDVRDAQRPHPPLSCRLAARRCCGYVRRRGTRCSARHALSTIRSCSGCTLGYCVRRRHFGNHGRRCHAPRPANRCRDDRRASGRRSRTSHNYRARLAGSCLFGPALGGELPDDVFLGIVTHLVAMQLSLMVFAHCRRAS
jgi:hypothetical protein